MVDLDPRTVLIGIPLAIFLFFAVGLEVSAARNEAAIPLVSHCPRVLWQLVTGGFAGFNFLAYTECVIGTMILVAIPGAFGIAMLALRD